MLILKSGLWSLVLNRVAKCAISEESFLPGRARTRVPRMSKFNKKQKQNRETKKKSKRYIRDSKVNRQGQPMNLFLKISILQARFYWLGDVEEMICPWKENVDGRKII